MAKPLQRAPRALEADAAAARDSAGLRTFLRICAAWELSAEQARVLLGTPERTFYHWKRRIEAGQGLSAPLPRDTLERISYVLGIWKALQILLPDPAAARAWVHRPNQAYGFGGEPALRRMLAGNVADLAFVRGYLDGQRG